MLLVRLLRAIKMTNRQKNFQKHKFSVDDLVIPYYMVIIEVDVKEMRNLAARND